MKDLTQIVRSPTKEVSQAKGALTKLWRLILKDVDLDVETLHRLLNKYLDDPENGATDDSVKRSYIRQNFVNALASNYMTWKTFRRALVLLTPLDVEISASIRWTKKFSTISSIKLNVSNVEDDNWTSREGSAEGLEGDEEDEHY